MVPPMPRSQSDDDQLSEAETVRLREAALKRMLATPPMTQGSGQEAETEFA